MCRPRKLGLVLAALAGLPSAQVDRVSRPFNSPLNGEDVVELRGTPDGNHVLYREAENFLHTTDMFRVPIAGGPLQELPSWPPEISPRGDRAATASSRWIDFFWFVTVFARDLESGTTRILADLSGIGNPRDAVIKISPDSEWVACLVDDDGIHLLRMDGSLPDPIQLGSVSGPARSVAFSPDGQRLVYHVGQDLFSVPADGSAPPFALEDYSEITSFAIASDGARVVWLGTKGSGHHLASRPLDGSGSIAILSGTPLSPGLRVRDYFLSPDGRWVFYSGDLLVDGRFELFRAPVDGSSSPVRLSGGLVSGGDVEPGYALDPTAAWVVFRADAAVNDRFELFTVPADGSAPRRALNPALVPGGDVLDFVLPAEGDRLAYRADQEADERIELYSVPIDGSAAPVRMSASPLADSDVSDYEVGPNGQVVYFLQDRDQDERVQLFAAAMHGAGGQAELNGPLGPDSDVLALAAGRGRVAYLADERPNVFELFSVSLAGVRTRLSGELEANPSSAVSWFDFCSRGERVVYVADRDQPIPELHGAALDGRPDFVRLHPKLDAGQTLGTHGVTSDGRWTLFSVSGAVYSALGDGHAPPIPLASDLFFAATSPDSRRVLLQKSSDGLYSAPLDGSAAPVRVSQALPPGAALSSVTPGGDRVLFRVTSGGSSSMELWSAPIDGSSPAILLGLVAPSVKPPAISADGAHAVFFDDRDGDGRFELYGLPTDGSRAAVRLHDAPVPGGGVHDFRIASDSTVVFKADLEVARSFELLRAPIDGSLPALKIAPATGNLHSFEVSPDATRVVLLASLAAALELYSVPIDGSQPPVKLNAPLPPNTHVSFNSPFTITPDSGHVLYAAPELSTGQEHLFRAPLLGGSALQLSADEIQGSFLTGYELSGDGRWVAYPVSGRLYVVPADGSALPERVSDVPPTSSGVGLYRFSPDSRRIAFLADLERRGVMELWQAELSHLVKRVR